MPAADASPVLSVRGLSAGYGESDIIHDVSFDVGAGETLVIVGPNGHGKSTVLRAISGLISASTGEVELDGRRIDGERAEVRSERGLIHIPQGDHLFPELTVEENLLMGAFPAAAWKRRAGELDRVYELFPKLRERREQHARTLSGGERRMVAVGRGLMRSPRLLVIDEPSLGLAPVIVEAVYETIERIAAQGTSILLVEENFTHIEGVADRVCVLEMGRIVRSGAAAEIAADATVAQSYLGVLEA
ncbi:MAG TPA: ABC transporter ATP-binding protein [Baekduia sp.]|nr:ABC transporter ATP-binding protein [Baekduia sp.]